MKFASAVFLKVDVFHIFMRSSGSWLSSMITQVFLSLLAVKILIKLLAQDCCVD